MIIQKKQIVNPAEIVAGDRVIIDIFNIGPGGMFTSVIHTRNEGTIFDVLENNGRLCVEWKENELTPLDNFSYNCRFSRIIETEI